MKDIHHKWVLLLCVTVSGFLLDWYSKFLVISQLSYGVPHKIVGNLLKFVFVYNKGLLFGINPHEYFSAFPIHTFSLIITIIVLGFLLFYYRKIPKQNVLLHWGVAMIFPGALGNLFDRIIRPADGVVDFIQIGLTERLHWYIFNVADMYVTAGMIVFMYCLLAEEKNRKNNPGLASNFMSYSEDKVHSDYN